jgi:imidazolonepropionase-like amidohydrolase
MIYIYYLSKSFHKTQQVTSNYHSARAGKIYSGILATALSFVACYPTAAQEFSSSVRKFISVRADTFALVHVKIVDGTGGPVTRDQTILIANGKILATGNTATARVPNGVSLIDCSGKTVIPGMIMMHEHLFYGESLPPNYVALEMPVSFPVLYLAGGVTTMRTAGSVEPQTDLNIREQITAGKLAGPDIDVTGPYIERAGLPIPEMLFIRKPEDAAATVNYWADAGCTSFKLYMNLTRADAKAAIDAAHNRKIKVTGHLCSISFREAADLGIDNLEHGFFVSSDFEANRKEDVCNGGAQALSIRGLSAQDPAMNELIAYLIKKNVAITSTLPVFEPYSGREIFPGDAAEAMTPAIRETIEKSYGVVVGKDSAVIAMFRKEMYWEREFASRGGRLLAGIDPTGAGRVIPGYADRHILELLVEAGFSLPEAVRICSLNAAEYLGRESEIGTVSVGKRADLVLVNGDLEADIHAVRNTETVFKNGVGFDSKKLFESAKGMVGLH